MSNFDFEGTRAKIKNLEEICLKIETELEELRKQHDEKVDLHTQTLKERDELANNYNNEARKFHNQNK